MLVTKACPGQNTTMVALPAMVGLIQFHERNYLSPTGGCSCLIVRVLTANEQPEIVLASSSMASMCGFLMQLRSPNPRKDLYVITNADVYT